MTQLRIGLGGSAVALACALVGIGCGDDDAMGGIDAGRDAGGGSVDGGGSDGGGEGDAGGGADAGLDAGTGSRDAGPKVVITAEIQNVTATGGCMPIVPEDPIQVEFDVVTHNSGAASTTATLSPVTLNYMNAA